MRKGWRILLDYERNNIRKPNDGRGYGTPLLPQMIIKCGNLNCNKEQIVPITYFKVRKITVKFCKSCSVKMIGNLLRGKPQTPKARNAHSLAIIKYYKNHPEARIQKAKDLVEYMSKNPGGFKDTIPELIVKAFLDESKIDYIHPKSIDRYSVDFFIPHKNLIIEVDGCFYHSCIIHKPYGEKGKQKRENDRVREEKIKLRGYRVLRIWEHDIKNSNRFKETINEALVE